jgi:D-aspartate ligase
MRSPTARHPTLRIVATAAVVGETDLVRALALARIRVAAMAPDGAPVRLSRYVKELVPWADSWREPAAFTSSLVEWAQSQDAPPTLFYDGDWDLLAISRGRDELAPSLRFVVAGAELVEDLVDKARFAVLSERLGLPVPPGRVLRPGTSSADDAAEVGFPAVVKPLTRQHETWRPIVRSKVARVASRSELDVLWDRLADAAVDVLVQREIPGPESAIESHHVYVDDSGDIVAEFTGRKLRTFPRVHGYTTALEITDEPTVSKAGSETIAALGLTGVAKLDFKRDEHGELHLLEVNPRFTLWHHPGAVAGVNIPELVHRDLCGERRPAIRRARAGVRWISPRDLAAARANGTSTLRWLRFALTADALSFSPLDPKPLVAAFARRR